MDVAGLNWGLWNSRSLAVWNFDEASCRLGEHNWYTIGFQMAGLNCALYALGRAFPGFAAFHSARPWIVRTVYLTPALTVFALRKTRAGRILSLNKSKETEPLNEREADAVKQSPAGGGLAHRAFLTIHDSFNPLCRLILGLSALKMCAGGLICEGVASGAFLIWDELLRRGKISDSTAGLVEPASLLFFQVNRLIFGNWFSRIEACSAVIFGMAFVVLQRAQLKTFSEQQTAFDSTSEGHKPALDQLSEFLPRYKEEGQTKRLVPNPFPKSPVDFLPAPPDERLGALLDLWEAVKIGSDKQLLEACARDPQYQLRGTGVSPQQWIGQGLNKLINGIEAQYLGPDGPKDYVRVTKMLQHITAFTGVQPPGAQLSILINLGLAGQYCGTGPLVAVEDLYCAQTSTYRGLTLGAKIDRILAEDRERFFQGLLQEYEIIFDPTNPHNYAAIRTHLQPMFGLSPHLLNDARQIRTLHFLQGIVGFSFHLILQQFREKYESKNVVEALAQAINGDFNEDTEGRENRRIDFEQVADWMNEHGVQEWAVKHELDSSYCDSKGAVKTKYIVYMLSEMGHLVPQDLVPGQENSGSQTNLPKKSESVFGRAPLTFAGTSSSTWGGAFEKEQDLLS